MEDAMKKILITLIMLLFVTGSAFATDVAFSGKITAVNDAGELIASMSAHVGGTVVSLDTNFACLLKHVSGTREFATSSADTSIYWKVETDPGTKGKETLVLTLTKSTSEEFSDTSWSKL